MLRSSLSLKYFFITTMVLCCLLNSVSLFAKKNEKSKSIEESKKVDSNMEAQLKDLETFNKAMHIVLQKYYRKVDTSKLVEGAIKGMLSTLDPHSQYLDKELFEKINQDTSGEFEGVGIEVVSYKSSILVTSTIHGSPAQKAGILPQDIITSINGVNVVGLDIGEALKLMDNQRKVKLEILRKQEKLSFALEKKRIDIESVEYKKISSSEHYIKIHHFQKSTYKEFSKALKTVGDDEGQGLIIDLRSNPGGLLMQSVNICSIFIRAGVPIVWISEKNQKEAQYAKRDVIKRMKTKLVVLVDEQTASAAEIVSACLQDHKRATIVGRLTFGKGSVQSVVAIEEMQALKLTIAEYLSPNQKPIQAIGVRPDIELPKVDQAEYEKALKNDHVIREIDLRGHLSSLNESQEEIETKRKMRQSSYKDRKKSFYEKDLELMSALRVLKTKLISL